MPASSVRSRPLIFTASLPPSNTAGVIAGSDKSWLEPYGFRYAGKSPFTPAYLLPKDSDFQPVPLPDGDVLDPWSKPPTGLSGSLLAPDGSQVKVTLRPLGSTLLRVTGFPTDELFGDGFNL